MEVRGGVELADNGAISEFENTAFADVKEPTSANALTGKIRIDIVRTKRIATSLFFIY